MPRRSGRNCITIIQIEVTEEVVSELNSYAIRRERENCGILLGSLTSNGVLRVNKTSPSLIGNGRSSRFECIRNAEMANKYISVEFKKSCGTRVYVGEWHTHPVENPTPSSVDISSVKEVFYTSDLPLKIVILAIAGTNNIYWGYYDNCGLHNVVVSIV